MHMGRDSIADKFEDYLDEMLGYAHEQLVEGHVNPLRSMELQRIEREIRKQRDAVLDCAEELADGADEPPEEHVDRFLKHSPFTRYYHGDDEEGLEQSLADQFREMVEDLVPIVDQDTDQFGEALRAAYPDRGEAQDVLEKNFQYVDTVKEYTDGMNLRVGPFTIIDFGEDIRPVIEEGEDQLKDRMNEDLDEIYD